MHFTVKFTFVNMLPKLPFFFFNVAYVKKETEGHCKWPVN